MTQIKNCTRCGATFEKISKESKSQWAARQFCSKQCSNVATGLKNRVPVIIRFWKYISKGPTDSDCWKWTGATDQNGYGRLSLGVGLGPVKSHRFSYEIHKGPIPEGMNICHSCDNPNCSNPGHLWAGTQKENMTDAFLKGRIDNFVHAFGEGNNAATLTNEQATQIRKEFAAGATEHFLREKYNNSNISRIVRNQVYADPNFTPINGNAKSRPHRRVLNDEQVSYVLSSSTPSRAMAKELNVSPPTILSVRKNKGYKNVRFS